MAGGAIEKCSKVRVEGRIIAKRGVRFGRPERPLPDNFSAALASHEKGEITQSQAARLCGMPLATFRYRAKKEILKRDLNMEAFSIE